VHEPGGPGQTFTLSLPGPERRTGRIVALAVGGVLIVFLGLYTMLVYSVGDRVPRGTTVVDVQVGGLSQEAAEARLRERLLPRAEEPIALTADGKNYSLKPASAGLALDVAGTAEEAHLDRTFNPVGVVRALIGGGEVEPKLTVDRQRLDKALSSLAKKIDTKAAEGAITFQGGTPEATEPKSGLQLDTQAAATRLQEEFLRAEAPIALPTAELTPTVGEAEVEQAMRDFAKPAMEGGSVKVQVGDESFDATTAEIGTALTMVAKDGKLTPRLDGKVLAKEVAAKLRVVEVTPRNAGITLASGSPQVKPGRVGHTVPPARLASAVLTALPKSGAARVAKVQTVTEEPELTTKAVEGMGIKEVSGEFTTYFPHAAYRNTNIGRAAELINGTLVKPDETFSLNDIVGERTESNGFSKGLVIKDGRLREELGGGVSQVATTTYNAAFFAGLEDVEHRPHGFYISRYPEGREATVYWGSLDLKWKNNTPYGVYVQAWRNLSSPSDQGSVTVRLWSTKYWSVRTETSERYNITRPKTIYDEEKEGCVEQEVGVEGFDVDVRRWVSRNGEVVSEERDHVRYKPEDKIVCGPKPGTPPKPAEGSDS
jgi:vancomycin resistance protein YoaR